jgi:hypothetical protein
VVVLEEVLVEAVVLVGEVEVVLVVDWVMAGASELEAV